MKTTSTSSRLAISGGAPVRTAPMPPRHLFGEAEKAAAMRLFDQAIESGNAFGYNGPEEQGFEKEFAAYMGGGFADGVNSGTNAVFAALGALQLPAGSEVIVPPISDPGGVMPVAVLNGIPVVADAAPGSFNTGPRQVEALITRRTRAIVVAHIGGIPADMAGIMRVARRHKLPVVEDCAQAQGAVLKGQRVGTFGDIAAFSTMFGKHIATGGQGGIVFTRNEDLYWKARRFADRGKPFNLTGTNNVVPALNLNLGDLGAAIGRVQLRRLPGIVARRRKVAAAIHRGLARLEAVFPARECPDSESSYWFLPLRVDAARLTVSKDDFAQALAAEGIPVAPSYRHIPSEGAWFRANSSCPTPWMYKGRVNTRPVLDNILGVVESHFLIMIHEAFDRTAVADTVRALAKVEKAYLRN